MGPDVGHELLEATAEPAALEDVHGALAALWVDVPDVSDIDRMSFETAVAEVAANVVNYCGGPVVFTLERWASPDRLEARFTDEGSTALADGAVEGAGLPDDELAEGGRGLALARATLDDLRYERDGAVNRWTLVRRRSP